MADSFFHLANQPGFFTLPSTFWAKGTTFRMEQAATLIRVLALLTANLRSELHHIGYDRSVIDNEALAQLHEALLQDVDILFSMRIREVQSCVQEAYAIGEKIRVEASEHPFFLWQAYASIVNFMSDLFVESVELSDLLRLDSSAHWFLPDVAGVHLKAAYDLLLGVIHSGDWTEQEREKATLLLEEFAAQFQSILDRLVLVEEEKLGLSVAAINPEAGNHAISHDPLELDAAIQAGRICMHEFPYLESRFGQRGRRFTISDSAWLAALSDESQSQLYSQVTWMGTMLSARGIPQIILQRHLEILHRELSRTIPLKQEKYMKILNGASLLRGNRIAVIDEREARKLREGFAFSVASDELQPIHMRFPNLALLVISAVVDEKLGVENAVPALLSWVLNKELFPQDWIEAVSQLVFDTRIAAKK